MGMKNYHLIGMEISSRIGISFIKGKTQHLVVSVALTENDIIIVLASVWKYIAAMSGA